MANIQHIKCKKKNGKRRQIAETSHSVKKSGAGNRMTTSEILLHLPIPRMRSESVAENGRKCD